MRIIIQSLGVRPIKLAFPTRMLFNGLTAKLGATSINKYVSTDDIKISSSDLKKLMKEIHNIKRRYPDLEVVDVDSCDGTKVVIKL